MEFFKLQNNEFEEFYMLYKIIVQTNPDWMKMAIRRLSASWEPNLGPP